MRIVHLILTRCFAGSERHVVELANQQVAEGHEVSVILRRSAAQSRPDAIAHRFDASVKIFLVSDWFRQWQARRVLKQLKPDVAHAHLNRASAVLKGMNGLFLRVATLHIDYKAKRHGHLDGVIAIAPWQMAHIPEPLRGHSVQIDNWTRNITPSPEARDAIRAAHGISPEAFVFGALGRVEESKGLDVLAAAWKKAALPASARLVIAGQGKAFQAIRDALPASVVMPGFVSEPHDWMAAFDVFVTAARSEPFGLVMLEAMRLGLPVLASESAGAKHLSELIQEPLLPIGDEDALAEALKKLYEMRPARKTYPMERFDMSARVADVEAFYRQGLARLGLRAS